MFGIKSLMSEMDNGYLLCWGEGCSFGCRRFSLGRRHQVDGLVLLAEVDHLGVALEVGDGGHELRLEVVLLDLLAAVLHLALAPLLAPHLALLEQPVNYCWSLNHPRNIQQFNN